jgi:sugar transferase (PEP-CTERM/EpsH1 system associated)
VNLLFITHRLPYPPDKGEKIRTFNQIRLLSKNHSVHVMSFVDDHQELCHLHSLKKYCASVDVVCRRNVQSWLRSGFALFFGSEPLSVASFARKIFAEKLVNKTTAEHFDCLFVSCSSMAQYCGVAPELPKIIDFIDVDSEKWRLYAKRRSFPLSRLYTVEAERLAKYEFEVVRSFDHSIVVSEDEQGLIERRVDRRVSTISNGVDLEYFMPAGPRSLRCSPATIIFTGAMDYFPNIDAVNYFCADIFPLVKQSVPEARFYIVGRNPTDHVRRLAKRGNVVVSGTVPDVRPYLEQASVAVAPFRVARGVQNKVLEAMAMGLPVVGTAEVFKGIAATERDGIRIANEPDAFARHVIMFLRDNAQRSQAGRQARRYVERHHRWDEQGAKLEKVLQEVVGRANPPSAKMGGAKLAHL